MEHFIQAIHQWYHSNQRDLPWRATRDPYLIWVSEIILQQTRMVQGLPYYVRFIRRFPTVRSLAEASDDQLMKLWEGLGYYSRARHMQAAAKTITEHHQGVFPDHYETVRSLKGIGEYTAAAIVSMAFGQPFAVVDGNVFRFLSRFLGISEPVDTIAGRKTFYQTAQELLDRKNPGFHNQAIMEFGALCCTPRNPGCLNCPVQSGCMAFQHKLTDALPVKSKKTVRKIRYFYFCVPEDEENVIIEKRTGKDIWKHLYQFPLFEPDHPLPDTEILTIPLLQQAAINSPGVSAEISREYIHILTHQEIRSRFIRMKHPYLPDNFEGGKLINKSEILKFAFPVLIRKFILETFPGEFRY